MHHTLVATGMMTTRRYFPSVDTYNRLMVHLQLIIANGMYVILDYQVGAEVGLWQGLCTGLDLLS